MAPEYGLQKPRSNLKISAKFNLEAASQTRPHLPLVSDIRVTRKNEDGDYRGSDGIYATAVHELTHTGHRMLDHFMFDFLTSGNKQRLIMIESWAEGVETIVTNDRYRGLDVNYIASNGINAPNRRGWNDNRQLEKAIDMNEYTPIVIDLIDNLNQNQLFLNGSPVDRVNGYNLNQIQSALNNSRNLEQWKQKLRWNFNNPTENNLDELFIYVNEVYKNL